MRSGESSLPKQKNGAWGSRGWGFHPRDNRKRVTHNPLSPRAIRDRLNGFRKD